MYTLNTQNMKIKYIFIIGCCLTMTAAFTAKAQPGSLDNTFGVGGKVSTSFGSGDDGANSVAIQSDGKIVAAGYRKTAGNRFKFSLARYNTNGSLDNTFGVGGKVITSLDSSDDRGNAIAIQANGKILVAGQSMHQSSYGLYSDFALVRYNTNGTLDNTFGSGGKVTTDIDSANDYGNAVVIQPNGKIIVAGQSVTHNWDFSLVRYDTTGAVDSTFGINGKVTYDFHPGGYAYDYAYSVALQTNGKILVAGTNSDTISYLALLRYNSNGTLDNTFGTAGKVCTTFGGSGAGGSVVAVQSDKKILVAGSSNAGTYPAFGLVRFDTVGNLDNTFGTGGKVTTQIGPAGATAEAMAIQTDGKIILAGYSYRYNYLDDFTVVRYNSNGTLDNTFGTAGIAINDFLNNYTDDGIYGVTLQGDGKIVAAGISNNGSDLDFALARYNVTSTIGIVENAEEADFTIYPNPNNGKFIISNNGNNIKEVEIYNVLGEHIYQSLVNNQSSEIDLSAQTKGIYFVKVKTEKGIVVKKFVKE